MDRQRGDYVGNVYPQPDGKLNRNGLLDAANVPRPLPRCWAKRWPWLRSGPRVNGKPVPPRGPDHRLLSALSNALSQCNPSLAHEALKLEDKVGTMLPCNVVVQDLGDGRTEVAAIDPVVSMQAIENRPLKPAAEQVGAKLKKFIEGLRVWYAEGKVKCEPSQTKLRLRTSM